MNGKNEFMKTKNTQSSLAALLGVTRQLIAAYRRKPNAPSLDDVAGWEALLAERGRIGSAPAEIRTKIAKKRLEILEQTKIKLARENEVESGVLMPVADARIQNGRAWAYIFDQMARTENELPPNLAGRTAVEIYNQLHDFTERMRTEARRKFVEEAA